MLERLRPQHAGDRAGEAVAEFLGRVRAHQVGQRGGQQDLAGLREPAETGGDRHVTRLVAGDLEPLDELPAERVGGVVDRDPGALVHRVPPRGAVGARLQSVRCGDEPQHQRHRDHHAERDQHGGDLAAAVPAQHRERDPHAGT
ncbi:hypothetical protein ACVDFE_10080 [Lentzea chajnantorensis]